MVKKVDETCPGILISCDQKTYEEGRKCIPEFKIPLYFIPGGQHMLSYMQKHLSLKFLKNTKICLNNVFCFTVDVETIKFSLKNFLIHHLNLFFNFLASSSQ